MREERDFDHVEPVFFSTSQAGGKGPNVGKQTEPVGNANDIEALKKLPVIISCQGGDYTNDIYPKLRKAGWKGYWIDAASALRMNDDAVIILDPVNMPPEPSKVDLSEISLDLGSDATVMAPKASGDPKWQEVATKLDLAKAYEEMGDKDGARELLKEVVKDGDAAQRGSAEQLLAKLG